MADRADHDAATSVITMPGMRSSAKSSGFSAPLMVHRCLPLSPLKMDPAARCTSSKLHANENAVRDTAVAAPVWTRLMNAGFPKGSVLINKRLPLEILRTLANDPSPEIRSRVADKRAAAPLLNQLAEDSDEGVRARVAYNAKTPDALLQRLAQDPVVQVANAARRRLGLSVHEEPEIAEVIEPADNSLEQPTLVCGVEMWIEPGGPIMLRAADGNDPVELNPHEAREIADILLNCANQVDGERSGGG